MASDSPLRLVVVTPETTVIDQEVTSLRLPLYDGQIGIWPMRAPLVGRLGYGEMIVTDAAGSKGYFIDGGFVQVNGPVISVMTDQAIPADKVDTEKVQKHLDELNLEIPTTDEAFADKDRDMLRTRQMLAVGKRFS